MFKKEKVIRSISEYSDLNVMSSLTKKSAGLTVQFIPTDEDGWYIDVIKYRTKTGVIVSISTILDKDMSTWENIYLKDEFIKTL